MGVLRMNYAQTPFQAKVNVKLIQIFLALSLCASGAGSVKNLMID